MKKYNRSICSTCRHIEYCSLTTDMSNISTCSEYMHALDNDNELSVIVSIEMESNNQENNEHKELVLN